MWLSHMIPQNSRWDKRESLMVFLIIFLNLMMVNMASEFSNLADFSLISSSWFIMGSTLFPLYTRLYGLMETPESLLYSKLFQLVRA